MAAPSALLGWLESLETHGGAALTISAQGNPLDFFNGLLAEAQSRPVQRWLEQRFSRRSLDLAGPPLPWAPKAAVWGLRAFTTWSWLYLDRSADERAIRYLSPPPLELYQAPETHFAADLTLFWLPQLYQLVKTLAPEDPLLGHFQDFATQVPLSSVGMCVEVSEAALQPIRAHSGLWLLYVDRIQASQDEVRRNCAVQETLDISAGAYGEFFKTQPSAPYIRPAAEA